MCNSKACVPALRSSSPLFTAFPVFPPYLPLSSGWFMLHRCCSTMPKKLQIHPKGFLVICVVLLASSLGVFVVRHLHISSIHFRLTFIRPAEHTECHRLAAVLSILNSEAHIYRRGEDRSYSKTSTSITENPTTPYPPTIIFIPFVKYPLEQRYNSLY